MEEENSEAIGQMIGFPTQKRREEVERVMLLGSIMPQEWDRSMYYLITIDPQAYLDLILPGLRYLGCLPEKLEGPYLVVSDPIPSKGMGLRRWGDICPSSLLASLDQTQPPVFFSEED